MLVVFQPIVVINHWYFIRHLKRWMICANEISIIYGSIRAHVRERDGALCFSNLRFVFIVFYVCSMLCERVFGKRERECAVAKRDWNEACDCRDAREWAFSRHLCLTTTTYIQYNPTLNLFSSFFILFYFILYEERRLFKKKNLTHIYKCWEN
jgi:hypothetical protein